jgi:hypothetical protein
MRRNPKKLQMTNPVSKAATRAMQKIYTDT